MTTYPEEMVSGEALPQPEPNPLYDNDIYDFQKQQVKLKRIINDWAEEVNKTEERRRTRDVEIDVQALRNDGSLDEDETLVPDRVIDQNIVKEQPPYINYLKNSRRLATFECISNPDINSQKLELEFTRGMTYIGWEVPHFKCLDGSQTHGWDWIEVVYDESKPLHVGLEHVGHDKLFFPWSTVDTQKAPTCIRAYEVTLVDLRNFVEKFGFDKDQVNIIFQAIKDGQKEPEVVKIYKCFYNEGGVIYVAWFTVEYAILDWLKKPAKHFLGIRQQTQTMFGQQWVDADVTQYPLFRLPYRETEKPKIVDGKGRVFLDEYKQEAQTAIQSGFINGLTRSSNVYAAYGQDDGTGSALQEVEGKTLTGGRIFNKPLTFFSPPYPDPMVLKALQWFDVSNDVEMGQPNFAATNRQDSRKTAKEIEASQNQQSLLNSVQLTLFSTHIRAIYNLVWLIVQSQALQGKIKFLLIPQQQPVTNPIDGTPIIGPTGQPQMQTIWVNDIATIKEVYDVRAAGDVDVIQKNEKVMQMKQDWPVIAQTPLAMPFLAELMRLEYPDTGEKWAQQIEQSGGVMQQMQMMINNLSHILLGVIKDNPNSINPQDKAGLMQVLTQAQQLAGQAAQQPEQVLGANQ